MKNVRKHKDIKLVATDKERYKLMYEFNYNTINCFPKGLLTIEMKKIEVKMNKLAYLGLPLLEISKILIYESLYDCIKLKY